LFSIHRGLLREGGAALRGEKGGRFAQRGMRGRDDEPSNSSCFSSPSGRVRPSPGAKRPPQRSAPLRPPRPTPAAP
jgi:hypothetical protein